ncbi:CAP domain-containing protein [Micromonospora sp. SL1-18]|uniref:CAP domain-containing protein n=1 Tax=Micromonospora sp. SL1-18 TaxID=3399128 RepID=UPI003A4E3DD0
MYRWTDPIEPDGVARNSEPPAADGPAWLTDQPEPRSAYLFGDEPEQPGADPADIEINGWQAAAPHEQWHPHEQWQAGAPHEQWQAASTGGWPAEGQQPTATWGPVTDDSPEKPGRHRQPRRFPRPLLVGGAAAASTLVVSLGVAALALPGDDRQTEPSAADGVVAVAPDATDAPTDALTPASPTTTPTASPSTAPSSARPSPTRTVTPKPNRSTAPSRQLQRTATPSSSATTSTRTASTTGLSAELRQVVDLVNQERAKAGCKAVTVDDKLTLAAQRHSQDQADHQTMTHDGSDGSDAGARLDRVGYAWRAYGENVAWNQQSPAAVMDAWMNSPGHRANILNCSFTEIGVGVARSNGPYWTQDFGTPR